MGWGMKQLTLATAVFERYAKTTRRAVFLAEMERVVPWSALCQAVLSQAAEGLRYVPRVIVTDKLKSYAAAQREILPSVEHR
jgi:hypothetical protein